MKSAKDLKYNLDLYPQEVSSSVKYFFQNTIDWDVYLPTKGINLQRCFVWTLDQKKRTNYFYACW